jgi:hypothetical protein
MSREAITVGLKGIRRRLRPAVIVGALALAVGAARGGDAGAALGRGGEVGSARAAIGRWLATQQMIAREKKDWQQARELLVARIDLVGKEIAAVEAKLAEAEAALRDLAQRRAGLAAESGDLKRAADRLAGVLQGLEARVRALHPALPPPLQERIAPLFERMPEDPKTARVSLAERYQNVLGVLNEVNRGNAEITLASEIRTLADGRPSEVRTVYVGLGQAYYVSPRGEAGVGRPSAAGWTWEPRDDLARGVTEVVEILQNKGHPRFVPLPVDIE